MTPQFVNRPHCRDCAALFTDAEPEASHSCDDAKVRAILGHCYSAMQLYGLQAEGLLPRMWKGIKAALKIRPVGDYLFVLPDKPRECTKSGLVIPFLGIEDDPCNPRAACTGTVVAVGRGAYTKKGVFVTSDIKVGDRILFSRFAGMDKGASLDGDWYRVMAECDVQLVIDPSAAIDIYGFPEIT
jgi:chaperonin GroES